MVGRRSELELRAKGEVPVFKPPPHQVLLPLFVIAVGLGPLSATVNVCFKADMTERGIYGKQAIVFIPFYFTLLLSIPLD